MKNLVRDGDTVGVHREVDVDTIGLSVRAEDRFGAHREGQALSGRKTAKNHLSPESHQEKWG